MPKTAKILANGPLFLCKNNKKKIFLWNKNKKIKNFENARTGV